jgi:hypothetical protein
VADFHCCLLRTPQGAWLVDLTDGSSTWVNGSPVRWAKCEEGDTLQLGPFAFRVRVELPVLSAAEPPRYGVAWDSPLADPLSEGTAARSELPQRVRWEDDSDIESDCATPVVCNPGLGDPLLQLQQQMMGQFQHGVLRMFQMFQTMQEEHRELVQAQMAQVRELKQDMHALRKEMLNYRPEALPVAKPTPGLTGMGTAHSKNVNDPTLRRPAVTGCPSGMGPKAVGSATGRDDAQLHAWLHERIAAVHQEQESHWQRLVHSFLGK